MSFSPKYGMIMADGAGDASNGKTPLRGVCGAQNAAAMAFRAAAAPSFRSVTKSARRRTYCTQYGARCRLARRFSARESGVPQLFTVCLPLRFAAAAFLAAASPPFCLAVSARRAAVVDASTARASAERAARGTRSPFAAAGICRPRRASAGWRPFDRGDRVFARDSRILAAGGRHAVGRRFPCRDGACAKRWAHRLYSEVLNIIFT